jgi:hypothetical protein
MGISLNGLTPAGTYPGLIKTGDNTAISGTPKVLSDGNGNNLPMEVSTTGVNFTNNLTQGGTALQPVLVSGTNIKTINGTSVLGSGNIAVVTSPSGVSGAIQFSDGSAFASDAANLFWDDTNNRLGVRTNAPSFPVDVVGEIRSSNIVSVGSLGTNGNFSVRRSVDGAVAGTLVVDANEVVLTEKVGSGGRLDTGFGTTALKWLGSSSQPRIGIGFNGSILATTHIKGSGSTSATTSLLVQNSAGTAVLTVKDDRTSNFNGFIGGNNGILIGAQTHTNVNPAEVCAHFFYRRDSSGAFQSGFDLSTSTIQAYGSLGVGSSPVASAILQADSTTKGFLPPRGTNTQMNAISSPATGLVFYDTTNNKLCCYNGSTWNDLF